ncbi:enoyl-CoA hydratase/isomerase family protein [Tepidimonas charontis]|uniref:3-hydroxyisobutyryl-CoA hydrolase n=1 Tax=Tepidimonas charontis TaxID=2267262 RepID=A0A554X757_9BURK|nr:enoyl-CoA hydratase/isomerase family protein [Tepidimonas charontis]TSE31665.1 Short-chain-enoyl-CoA hydratase [Tepidimonas charontis]
MSAPLCTADVVFTTLHTASGRRFERITLNAPKSLNALALSMVDAIAERLRAWAADPDVAGIWLDGAGPKAFCAGGDVVALYHDIRATLAGQVPALAAAFFEREYRLDYLIHTYPKPVLCWAHGHVMGGGIGLMAGASHRVVTTDARLAMPEVSIGLYPDVGGSWLLGRLPAGLGAFLSATGAPLNATDARLAGLADWILPPDSRDGVLEAVIRAHWSGDAATDRRRLSALLHGFDHKAEHRNQWPPSRLLAHAQRLADVMAQDDWLVRARHLLALTNDPDPWLAQAARTFAAGSPTSAALGWEMQRRAKHLSLADVFRLEWQASVGCCMYPDFAEGVRALLVDKDRCPRWQPQTIDAVTPEWIDAHLRPWHTGPHPLADLT